MTGARRFAPNEVIITEGENGETAFLIETGRVFVSKGSGAKQVPIAFLEAGAVFGEMSMVDDLPRSATVTAVEETWCREVHRDDIYATMQDNPDAIIKFLKNIFERLREANVKIAQLGAPAARGAAPAVSGTGSAGSGPLVPGAAQVKAAFTLEALTERAAAAIAVNPITFRTFPYNVGRRSADPLVNNHMEIDDKSPLQISRHHVSIVRDGDRIGVVDRGSQLGALVDNVRIGGGQPPGPVFFKGASGTLVLGSDASPYRYRISQKPG